MGLKLRSNRTPALTLSNLPASVDEGQSISPIISFTAADNNIITPNLSFNAYWEISGVGIGSTDFEDVGVDGNPDSGTTLTGYVNLTGTTTSKQFSIGIRSDNFTDLNVNETATFSLYSDAARTELIDSDTFIINDTSMGEPQFDFLLVGGGGKGGFTEGNNFNARCAGGGGAGGVLVVSNEPIGVGTTIYCQVAATRTGNFNGNSTYLRQDTSGGTILHQIKGGGRGASESTSTYSAGNSLDPWGGSGGGGAGAYSTARGNGGSYGRNGGNGTANTGGGGGGGGYGSSGGNGSTSGNGRGGNGGNGYSLSNFFSSLVGTIAGGGGGGGYYDGSTYGTRGTGTAGGGDGGNFANGTGENAQNNTGSGGGGASPWISFLTNSAIYREGGDGGSGVIYLKYIAPESLFTYSGAQTVNSYIVSSGGGTKKYWVHKLTTSGQLTRTS